MPDSFENEDRRSSGLKTVPKLTRFSSPNPSVQLPEHHPTQRRRIEPLQFGGSNPSEYDAAASYAPQRFLSSNPETLSTRTVSSSPHPSVRLPEHHLTQRRRIEQLQFGGFHPCEDARASYPPERLGSPESFCTAQETLSIQTAWTAQETFSTRPSSPSPIPSVELPEHHLTQRRCLEQLQFGNSNPSEYEAAELYAPQGPSQYGGRPQYNIAFQFGEMEPRIINLFLEQTPPALTERELTGQELTGQELTEQELTEQDTEQELKFGKFPTCEPESKASHTLQLPPRLNRQRPRTSSERERLLKRRAELQQRVQELENGICEKESEMDRLGSRQKGLLEFLSDKYAETDEGYDADSELDAPEASDEDTASSSSSSGLSSASTRIGNEDAEMLYGSGKSYQEIKEMRKRRPALEGWSLVGTWRSRYALVLRFWPKGETENSCQQKEAEDRDEAQHNKEARGNEEAEDSEETVVNEEGEDSEETVVNEEAEDKEELVFDVVRDLDSM